jgi:hypothetical protein
MAAKYKSVTRECDTWHVGSNVRVQKAFSGPGGFPSGAKGAHSGAREEKGLEKGRGKGLENFVLQPPSAAPFLPGGTEKGGT